MEKGFEDNKTIADLILMNDPLNSTLFIVEHIFLDFFFQTAYPISEALIKNTKFLFKNDTCSDCAHNIYKFNNNVNTLEGGFPEWVVFKWENEQIFGKCSLLLSNRMMFLSYFPILSVPILPFGCQINIFTLMQWNYNYGFLNFTAFHF